MRSSSNKVWGAEAGAGAGDGAGAGAVGGLFPGKQNSKEKWGKPLVMVRS